MNLGEARNREELLNALKEAVSRREDLRRPWDTQWWNNVALIAGDHYTRWDPTRGDFVPPPPREDDYTVRLVLNHSLTIARTELAKLTKGKPVMDVVAASDSSEDIAAAKVGQQILEGFEWKFRMRKRRKQAYWWMVVTGLGAEYVGFDPTNDSDGKFEYYVDPATNEPTWGVERVKQLKEMVQKGELLEDDVVQEEPLGELDFKTYSPFQLLPDETALEWSDLKDLITVDVVDVDVAKANWNNKKIMPESGIVPGTISSSALFRAGMTGLNQSPREAQNAVAIYTWWLLPGVYKGRYLEQGKMIRWCNTDNVLEESEVFPFIDCRMPFAFFEHIPNAVSLWPDSVLTHVRHVNLEMDKTASQLIENKDYMANPMWVVALQHDLPKDMKSKPGNIIRYRHVPNIPPPEPVPGVPMPQQVEELLNVLRSQMLDISGQGEISRGNQLPSGVRSGVQVAYLQEEDETRLGPTAENIEDGVAVLGSLALSRVSQFYHTERIVRLYKPDGTYDALKFKGADIKGNTDVVCLPGSSLPKMRAVRQQFVMELAQMGIWRDPHKIEQALELGEGEPDSTDKAAAQADRENRYMTQGVLLGADNGYYSITEGAVGYEDQQQGPPQLGEIAGADVSMGGMGPNGQPLSPAITTMFQEGTPETGQTRSVFEAGAAAPEGMLPPGVSLGGVPTEPGGEAAVPEGTVTPEGLEAALAQRATGAEAPTERGKKGPQAIPVFKWHNHTVHLDRHYSFMMEEDFERIGAARPEIVRLFNEHTAMHERELAAQRQQQLAALEAAKGAPGPQGEGAVSPSPEGTPDAALQSPAGTEQGAPAPQ